MWPYYVCTAVAVPSTNTKFSTRDPWAPCTAVVACWALVTVPEYYYTKFSKYG